MFHSRLLGQYLRLTVAVVLLTSSAWSQAPGDFPWGQPSSKSQQGFTGTPPVYKVLSKLEGSQVSPQPVILQPYPQQQAYAYGWFGSNPTTIWGRHFGTSKSYTQWTGR